MPKILKPDNLEIRAGGVILSSGFTTASNPNITQEGNTSAGIYFPAQNEIGISTNGIERLKIDQTGLVTVQDLTVINNLTVGTGANNILNVSVGNSSVNIVSNINITGLLTVSNGISGTLSGTATNANFLSGYSLSELANPNTIVLRDTDGDGYFSKINLTGLDNEVSSGDITQIYVKSNDSFLRRASLNAAAGAILNVATGLWNIGVTGAIFASGFNSEKTITITGSVTGRVSTDFFSNPIITGIIPSNAVANNMLDDIVSARTVGDGVYMPVLTINSKGRITSIATALAGGIIVTGADPSSPTIGQVWFNTTSQTLKYYVGTTRTISWG